MTPSAPQPRLTVIVPAYNVAPWLEQCIQSIRQQSLTDLEIIVVDDGSTDATGELLEAWVADDPRLKVLHQPNAGQSAARNRALELVRSPLSTETITSVPRCSRRQSLCWSPSLSSGW